MHGAPTAPSQITADMVMAFYKLCPHISIRTYHWLDKLPYWEDTIDRRILKRTAFDFMLK